MTEEQALSKLASECSRSEHCTGEMADKLRRWGFDETVQARIIAYLVEHRYVDDSRYAEIFIREKMKFNHWGPRKIEQALWGKRVDEDVYRPVLRAVSREEWVAILCPMLRSKARSVKAATAYEQRMKLMRFAVGRGFTMDVIEEALSEYAEHTEK